MKKLFFFFLSILLFQEAGFSQPVYDDNYVENPNYIQGNKFLQSSQYSSAINEFKKAIRTNPNDVSALIALSNAYNMRAVYYNNTAKSTENAISDTKSALFFSKYYSNSSASSPQSIAAMQKNLSTLESATGSPVSSESRYNTAKTYRTKGEFAAAAYDYYQLLNDPKYVFEANSALGDIYKIFNRPDMSVNFYKTAQKYNPDNSDIHLKLARVYEQINDFSSALNEYGFAINNSSEREDILNSLERIWQKKVDENPKDAEVHANLGVVFQKQKRYSEALAEYQKAESLNPSNVNTKLNIATLFQEQKRYNDALNIYNQILKTQPNNVSVLIYKAECLKALNKNDDAVSTFKAALNLDPKNTNAKAELFELLKDTMPAEQVLDFLYKNVQNSPMNADSYYEFAYELHKNGKIDDAITYYLQTIKLDNKKIDAYINLSQAYRQKQNYNDAYAIIKKAQTIAPDNELVKKQLDIVAKEYDTNNYNLASNMFQSGDYEKAIEEYKKINPPTADSLIGIAAAYQSLKNNTQAITYYKKAMELDSKNSDLPYYIASIYSNDGDIQNAKTYIDMALAKNPSNKPAKELAEYIKAKQAEALISQASKLYDEKKYTEALQIYNQILKDMPSNASIYYYRAMAYDAVNNYKAAIADYKSTLKYAPDMVIAYYSIAVDYDALENYQAAKENYKKYLETVSEDNDYTRYAKSRIDEIK